MFSIYIHKLLCCARIRYYAGVGISYSSTKSNHTELGIYKLVVCWAYI